MTEYYRLLRENKVEEAEEYRTSHTPEKLIKFFSLSENIEENNKKFASLESNQIWFSKPNRLNDPYEFKAMYINRSPRTSKVSPVDDLYNASLARLVNQGENFAVASFSANSFDCLPMWAYYTNNYQGFCVEYDIVNPQLIHEVEYEDHRTAALKYAEPLCKELLHLAKDTPNKTALERIILQQFYIKHSSWRHEKEYRIIYPYSGENGLNVPLNLIGLKIKRIVAGLNCSLNNLLRLNYISNKLGCGNISQCVISEEQYTLVSKFS